MRSGGILLASVLAALLAACAGDEPLPEIAVQTFEATVGSYAGTACSTSVVDALSRQIADEVNCMAPGTLTTIAEGNGIEFNYAHVLPYVTPEAKQAMRAAVAARGGTLRISSLYRTVAQQYLLYRWWQQGRCGITAAATPGNSNHESGRAVDVSNYADWIAALGNRG